MAAWGPLSCCCCLGGHVAWLLGWCCSTCCILLGCAVAWLVLAARFSWWQPGAAWCLAAAAWLVLLLGGVAAGLVPLGSQRCRPPCCGCPRRCLCNGWCCPRCCLVLLWLSTLQLCHAAAATVGAELCNIVAAVQVAVHVAAAVAGTDATASTNSASRRHHVVVTSRLCAANLLPVVYSPCRPPGALVTIHHGSATRRAAGG